MAKPDGTQPRTSRSASSALPFSLVLWVTMSVTTLLAVGLGLQYSTAFSSIENVNITVAASLACNELSDRFGSPLIVLPSAANYTAFREENWSQTASLVTYLVRDRVPFAIRSGGHSPNPFDATIDGGVLISLDHFDEISYHVKTGLVTPGPGTRWDAVYAELDKYNKTMMWWTVTVSWSNAADDATLYAAGASFHDRITALATARNVSLGYIFMNDANMEQPVIAS
ncbi:hypothetical protein F4861DRAFT_543255 [Xylaria intraflava]|nr:hypothetical protein F4861DRAFT_543255 [Xylaria intraflava]